MVYTNTIKLIIKFSAAGYQLIKDLWRNYMTVKIFGVSIKISKEHMVIAFLVLALVFLYIGFILWKSGEDIIVQTNAGKGDIELSVGDNKKEEKTEDL